MVSMVLRDRLTITLPALLKGAQHAVQESSSFCFQISRIQELMIRWYLVQRHIKSTAMLRKKS